ncbi:MAG: NAD(P)H-dependent oxidoreductase [Myxococcota bacterium]|nr:NAD(P)H-dependent oxidoreductase [Deltaproteobacteria bacterium]MDQ3337471.1 NAD(P)H-dependent oxidoreductase [Myxococcota bacterium]
MTTIVAISGSLREGSLNTKLLRAAQRLAPAGTKIEEATIRGIPLYDGDEEAKQFPASVTALKDRVIAADGVLLVSPEYNNGIPGVFKNAIDWMSRPASDIEKVFGKPFGLIGVTPGRGSTSLGQAAWLPVLRTLGTMFWSGGRLGIPSAGSLFDGQGEITDAKVKELLEKYVTGFAKFVAEQSGARG